MAEIKRLQEKIKGEYEDMFERFADADRLRELKQSLGLIIPPKDGEACESCSG